MTVSTFYFEPREVSYKFSPYDLEIDVLEIEENKLIHERNHRNRRLEKLLNKRAIQDSFTDDHEKFKQQQENMRTMCDENEEEDYRIYENALNYKQVCYLQS